MDRTLVLILGMHRSGTSLLTNMLASMGAEVGDFSDIKDEHNPDGYAEHPAVRDFNNRLLAHLGVSWDNWGFRASSVDFDAPEFVGWRNEAVTILRDAFSGSGPFVLKDPRIAFLAPFWEDHIIPAAGFSLRRILILREPAEVAESQLQRVARTPGSFPIIADPESMSALWAVTMYELLLALGDDNTFLITHGNLLQEPAKTMYAAAEFSGFHPDLAAMAHSSSAVVKAKLYRARGVSDDSGPWMDAARALYADLCAAGTNRSLLMADARDIALSQTQIRELLPSLTAVCCTISRMEREQKRYQAELNAINRMIWSLVPLAKHAPKPQLEKATHQIEKLASSSDLLQRSFPFGHGLCRLLLFAGRRDDALACLERIRPYFGGLLIFSKLEEEIYRDSKNSKVNE